MSNCNLSYNFPSCYACFNTPAGGASIVPGFNESDYNPKDPWKTIVWGGVSAGDISANIVGMSGARFSPISKRVLFCFDVFELCVDKKFLLTHHCRQSKFIQVPDALVGANHAFRHPTINPCPPHTHNCRQSKFIPVPMLQSESGLDTMAAAAIKAVQQVPWGWGFGTMLPKVCCSFLPHTLSRRWMDGPVLLTILSTTSADSLLC
jgi:hypothetical protein